MTIEVTHRTISALVIVKPKDDASPAVYQLRPAAYSPYFLQAI
jgi:hypothetical protein